MLIDNMLHKIIKMCRPSVFIETGTHDGSGITQALNYGFKIIISVDIDNDYVTNARQRFSGIKSVIIHHSDSVSFLTDILPDCKKLALIYLDAHYPGRYDGKAEESNYDNKYHLPLIDELSIISRYAVQDHIIIIDDINHYNIDEVDKFISDHFGATHCSVARDDIGNGMRYLVPLWHSNCVYDIVHGKLDD